MTTMKKLLVVFGALVAVAAIVTVSVLGTIAYLTSSAAVSNVFTIGNVGITMTESKVDENGNKIDDGATQVDTNTYHLVPNKKYTKDPTITVNANSASSYLFVLVRNDLEAIAYKSTSIPQGANPADYMTIADQMKANGWYPYATASTGTVYVYAGFTDNGAGEQISNVPTDAVITSTVNSFAENNATAATVGSDNVEKYKLFDYFIIDPKADVSTYGAAKITLTAVAIQTDGFGTEGTKASVDAAWAAVKETYPYIHTGNS